MTILGKGLTGIAISIAVVLLAPAATAEQKSRRPIIDNEGYAYLGGGPFGAPSGPGFGASHGPFNFFQPQGPRLRGQTNAQPVGGNETETIGLGRTHTVRSGSAGAGGRVTVRGWDPGTKKQTTGAASGDPDQPFMTGRLPNSTQPVGGNETETIGLGRTHTVRSGRTGTTGKVTVRGWDPGSKKQTTGAASGDPDRPVILGSPPNPAYQGARSSAWFRVQQPHTTGSAFPSGGFGVPSRFNAPGRR